MAKRRRRPRLGADGGGGGGGDFSPGSSGFPSDPSGFLGQFRNFKQYHQNPPQQGGGANASPFYSPQQLTHSQFHDIRQYVNGPKKKRNRNQQQGGANNVPQPSQPSAPHVPVGGINPPPTGAPGVPGTLPATGTPTSFSPTLGNTYQDFQSYAPGQWQAYSGPEPQGIAQGTYFDPTANDTQRFTYDTFAGGHTYKPMPTGATGGAGNANYPFSGYAPPPQNIGYFNQGAGWNWPTDASNYQQMTWDQYAQTLQGMPGTTPYFKQNVAPSAAQDVWWANPVVTDPGYYDPWAELRNLSTHFGDERPGTLAGQTALGIQQGGQGQLDYYRYLAHQAGVPGYANLTGPLAPGYHSPNIGGTYGAPVNYG